MDVESVNFYYLDTCASEICRAESSDEAYDALKHLIGVSETSHICLYDMNDYGEEGAPYLNLVEEYKIIGCLHDELYVGQMWENPSSGIYLTVDDTSREKINTDIIAGKTFFKDGSRAKAIRDNDSFKYATNMTFWWSQKILWATFPTDHEAVLWMLNQ